MPTPNQSSTPRTDRFILEVYIDDGDYFLKYVKPDDARQLEQELNEAHGQLRIIDRLLNLADIPIGNEHENYDTKQRVEILTKIKSSCWVTIDKLREDYITLHSQLATSPTKQTPTQRVDLALANAHMWWNEMSGPGWPNFPSEHFDLARSLALSLEKVEQELNVANSQLAELQKDKERLFICLKQVHEYLMLQIKHKTLNESASDKTQQTSRIVSEVLDAAMKTKEGK
jgi:hypothetical protein